MRLTLRDRLALRYAVIVAVCLLLLVGLAHHEFLTEVRLHQQYGTKEPSGLLWGEYFELFAYSMIPVVLGGGWWLMRRTLIPINTLAQQMENIHAHNLHQPLPRTGTGDEVDRLTEVFNAMTTRLDQSFQQMKEFTIHASHELKTPLTVMRAELETALQEGQSLPEDKRDWIYHQLDEVQRLTSIVDTLIVLAKADAGQIKMELKPVRFQELVQESFEDAVVLAEPHHVGVTLLHCDDLTVSGDRHRLRQLLLNLVDNAVKYNQPGGTVTMSLEPMEGFAQLKITNTGKGISPEMQAHVFNRFVRGDNALTSAVEGAGLGLTIAQWIVQAHCGFIRLSSEPNKQTSVIVHIPLAPPDSVTSH